jgi:DNA-binding beta-propeller fold protein YncE
MTGKLKTEIDLSHLAEVDDKTCNKDEDCEALLCIDGRCARDGLPELAAMHIHGDHLFVMVQRLDSDSLFRARDVSKIAVIDITSDKFIKAIDTKGKNPTAIQVSADGRSIYISQPGNWLDGSTAVLDGLIEEFDLVEMRHRRIVLEEKTLGGNIASVAIVSPTKGYVVRSDDNWRTELLTFNPSTAQLGDVIATSPCLTAGACHTFFQIALSPNGQLYLVDRDQKRSGIRIFDTNTDREITAQTIDMGLPPTSLIFYP